jgi:hypothetical protein
MNLFPLSIYKLLVYYEKISLFEAIYEKEKQTYILSKKTTASDDFRMKSSSIINDSFSYAVIIDNITVALYLLRKYNRVLHFKSDTIVDSLLLLLNEYCEHNGAMKYQNGVTHVEEILYLIDVFLDSFTFKQCNFFLRIAFALIAMESPDDEECDADVQEKVLKGYRVNQLRSSIMVFNPNPLKTCLLIIDILYKIKARNSTMEKGSMFAADKYIKLFGII